MARPGVSLQVQLVSAAEGVGLGRTVVELQGRVTARGDRPVPCAGAAVPRGGADEGRPAAEVTGGAAQAAGAAAGRAGDRRARARA